MRPAAGTALAAGLFLAALLAAATATAKTADKVDTWHDRAIDFAAYRVFDTDPVPPGTANRLARGIRTREDDIRDALITAFTDRGYVYDPDADRVDFILHFTFNPPTAPRKRSKRLSIRFRQSNGRSEYFDTHVNHLHVELHDPETGFPTWRGRSERVLGKRIEDDAERLEAAALAIGQAFPPEPYSAPVEGPDGEQP